MWIFCVPKSWNEESMYYKTIVEKSTGEIVEKKSRFIADMFPVESEEEALEYIEQVRKKYYDARHHCFAYVLNDNPLTERFSDDGEPGGTAGKPILDVLKGAELKNTLIVVTRYFGGTLLGTGGLVRAYTSASREAVAAGNIVKRTFGYKMVISTDYTGLGKIQYILCQESIPMLDTVYTEAVDIIAFVPDDREEEIINKLTEATNGKSVIKRDSEYWFEE